MTYEIYTQTEAAKKAGLDWDQAIDEGEIETVEEIEVETTEEAYEYFESNYDPDYYGITSV